MKTKKGESSLLGQEEEMKVALQSWIHPCISRITRKQEKSTITLYL